MSHTKGPWKYVTLKNTIVIMGDGEALTSTIGVNSEANALLIAAAPEMLKQLEICLAHMATTSTIWDDTERIINKAKGV